MRLQKHFFSYYNKHGCKRVFIKEYSLELTLGLAYVILRCCNLKMIYFKDTL